MAKLKCALTLVSDSPHTYQVITGFIMLAREGIIDLNIEVRPERVKQYPTQHIVEAVVGPTDVAGMIRIAYDTLDGYNYPSDAIPLATFLANVDCYFKRSFASQRHHDLEFASRILPLGLNYQVVTSHKVFSDILRYGPAKVGFRRRVKRLVTRYYKTYSVEQFEDVPHSTSEPRILFATRTWNPGGENGETPDSSGIKAAEREYINSMRAECIRLLRETYGSRFIGGFAATEYAQRHYPELILDDSLTKSANFLALMKRADICVASMGLHESNGWKLGEYVAASKAIVSERLRYSVPGDFTPGKNYLEFATPEECVANVAQLFGDEQETYRMKCENYRYYHQFVRPDRMVLNTLMCALEQLR